MGLRPRVLRRRRVLAACLTVGTLAAVLSPLQARGAQVPPSHATQPAGSPPLEFLHVEQVPGQRAELVDEQGRTVILRGTALRGVEDDFYPIPSGGEPGAAPQYPIDPADYDGKCPPTRAGAGEPPACEVDSGLAEYAQASAIGSRDDLAEIRAQGFNFIRLPVSWSLLEPQPGQYSTEYLDRIAQVVGWAAQQGIYVLLDMHQDSYSRFIPDTSPINLSPLIGPAPEEPNHADGAPAWAVMTHGVPPVAVDGQGELDLAVESAFTSFWLNEVPTGADGKPLPQGEAPGPGLEDHYIGALAFLARRFRNDPAVVGYEIMNEPLPGLIAPVAFSTAYLYPFYRRVIDALTGVKDGLSCPAGQSPPDPLCGYPSLGVDVSQQSIFFEPMAIRNLEDAPDQVPLPFSTYPNLVYAPHDYTHVFTVDAELGIPPSESPYPLSYDQAYQVADLEARLFGSALVFTEFGDFSPNPAEYDEVMSGMTAAQDKYLVGSSYWAWTGDAVSPILTRAYPRATAGTLESFAYNPGSRSFAMTATDARAVAVGDRSAETIVEVPSGATGGVRVSGAARLDAVVRNRDGTRFIYVAPTGAGAYSIAIAP